MVVRSFRMTASIPGAKLLYEKTSVRVQRATEVLSNIALTYSSRVFMYTAVTRMALL